MSQDSSFTYSFLLGHLEVIASRGCRHSPFSARSATGTVSGDAVTVTDAVLAVLSLLLPSAEATSHGTWGEAAGAVAQSLRSPVFLSGVRS